MLFAPKRGPDARRRVAYQFEHLTTQAKGFLRQLFRSGPGTDARRNSEAVVEDAEARADHIRDDIDDLMEKLRQASETADETN